MYTQKQVFRVAGAVLLSVWCASCITTANVLPAPEGLRRPGAGEAPLRRGRVTLVTGCTSCHRLHWPREYEPSKWKRVIRDHGTRSGLSGEELADVELYLTLSSEAIAAKARNGP